MLLLFFSLCIIYMWINTKSVLHQTSSPGMDTLFPTQILYTHKLQLQLFLFFSALCAYTLYNKLKTKQQQQSARWHTWLDRWSQWYIIVTWFLLLSFWGLSGLNCTLSSSAQNTPSENHLNFELCKKSNLLIPTQCRGHQNRYEWEKVKRGCYHAGGISAPTESENNTINFCCC